MRTACTDILLPFACLDNTCSCVSHVGTSDFTTLSDLKAARAELPYPIVVQSVSVTRVSEYFGNMSSTAEIVSSFIQDAPPGELQEVVKDIQSLTSHTDPFLLSRLKPAFQKYNEEQLATADLPAGTQAVRRTLFSQNWGRAGVAKGQQTDISSAKVIISKYNRLPDGRYFDTESNTSFDFDHVKQVSRLLYLPRI